MHNFPRPTILTAEQYNTSVSIQVSNSDVSLEEMYSMFESLIISLGYQKKSLDTLVLEMAAKMKLNEHSNTKSN